MPAQCVSEDAGAFGWGRFRGELKRAGRNNRAPVAGEPDHVNVLRAAVNSARAGRGRMVSVGGPAGIGKTHLLQAAAESARPGLVRLFARGTELERDMPFGAPLQLLEAPVRQSPESLGGAAAMSRRLFALDPGPGTFGDTEGRHLLIHSLYRLVADLADRRPLASARGRRARTRCAVAALPGLPRTSCPRSAGLAGSRLPAARRWRCR